MGAFPLGLLLLILPFSIGPYAQEPPRYIQMETEDSILFLDDEGVAIKAEKTWACRRLDWVAADSKHTFNRARYLSFREARIAEGTWTGWTCQETPGDILWSRAIRDAQRKLNMSAVKKPCSPWVPETGYYNREMFEYSLCALRIDLEAAREDYAGVMALRLGLTLRMEPPSAPSEAELARYRAAVIAAARQHRLLIPTEGCGRTMQTLFDFVECAQERLKAELDDADRLLVEHSRSVESSPRGERLIHSQVREMQEQSAAVKAALDRVLNLSVGGH